MIYPEQLFINDDGIFPGNMFPVLVYKNAIPIPPFFVASKVRDIFNKHNWTNTWHSGIYTYHHYHSNTHEGMAAIKGKGHLLLGGDNGTRLLLEQGDIIVIPAGVAHKNLGKVKDIICIGGYPDGKEFDMNYGNGDERPATEKNIQKLQIPTTGPLYGRSDPLLKIWNELYWS